ncbi:MAG TPA: beta-ketoacyl synthase N-terminal-like domain-containing protein [Bryobacteraceae bacterium]|nr:beta-ketoacyl synthase N-terminal-like domain-containing protein [Bryobacteraceae bacterium]
METAQPLAITSVGALFPGAPTTEAFWRDILEGRDRITDVPRTHWLGADYFATDRGTPDKVYTARGGFLPDSDFAPGEFGIPPRTLPAIDSAQLLGLLIAKRVLHEATRGRYESMDRSRISVILGVASATEMVAHMSGRLQLPLVERAMRASGIPEHAVKRVAETLEACYVPWQENTFPGLLGNVVAGRIANRLDLGGTNTVVDAACAGSLAALSMAAGELWMGRADMVVTGGVDALNDILMFMCFAQTGALSVSGECRPFSAEADGTLLGEGVGLFALRRLEDAERDGDPVYAVLRGIGTSSDGKATSIYAPSVEGQMRALRRAYESSGISPATIELIEAHGTGTRAGDAVELEALLKIYGDVPPEHCAIGSIKSQIGHTKAAAGSAGLAKAALALHHKVLPPTIKVNQPAPSLAGRKTPFYLNTAARPWIRNPQHSRRAALSALGFGGTNFHVIVEEYRGASQPARIRAMPSEMVALSAPDDHALASLCRREAAKCFAPGALPHLAKRSQSTFDATASVRLAFVASNEDEAGRLLERAAKYLTDRQGDQPRDIHFSGEASAGPVAFLFPGQGSQYAGMGASLAIHFEPVRELWDQTAALTEFEQEPLHARVFPVPVFSDRDRDHQQVLLRETDWAQPALTCASLSMLRLLKLVDLRPLCVAGHSLGEVTALAASGAISAIDAIRIARLRGQRMAEASHSTEGAMLAVSCDRAALENLLLKWNLPLTLANDNSPRQVVLSGTREAIEAAAARLSAEHIASTPLPVATAFHSPIVAGACEPFAAGLSGIPIQSLEVPVFSNVTAEPYSPVEEDIRPQLASAVAKPVRFVEMIDAMYRGGARTFIEVGPEAVLTKLVKRCLAGKPHLAIALDDRNQDGVTAFHDALARLSAAGIPMKLESLWEGQRLPEAPPTDTASQPRLSVQISGANFEKPYPQKAEQIMDRAKPVEQPTAPQAQTTMTPNETAAAPLAPQVPADGLISQPPSDKWLWSLRELHAPLIAAQMEHERLLAESHSTFLRAIESSYATLRQRSSGAAMPAATAHGPSNGVMRMSPPPVARPAEVSAAAPRPTPPPAAAALAGPPVSVPPPVPAVKQPAPTTSAETTDLMPLVLEIVAEKTGYPVEMIQPNMDLEGELGIDSIKRVEILSAMKDRVPALPDLDTAKMSKLRTMAEIVNYFESSTGEDPVKKKS